MTEFESKRFRLAQMLIRYTFGFIGLFLVASAAIAITDNQEPAVFATATDWILAMLVSMGVIVGFYFKDAHTTNDGKLDAILTKVTSPQIPITPPGPTSDDLKRSMGTNMIVEKKV